MGSIRAVFRGRGVQGAKWRISAAGGQRFQISSTAGRDDTSAPITVVLNWTAGLRR